MNLSRQPCGADCAHADVLRLPEGELTLWCNRFGQPVSEYHECKVFTPQVSPAPVATPAAQQPVLAPAR